MICPTCKIEMKIGLAIDAGPYAASRGIMYVDRTINAYDLKLIEVYKCPSCGYSDDGVAKKDAY